MRAVQFSVEKGETGFRNGKLEKIRAADVVITEVSVTMNAAIFDLVFLDWLRINDLLFYLVTQLEMKITGLVCLLVF